MKTKKTKLKKKTTETGAAQMAGPSGPQYDTTGNQRLENIERLTARHLFESNWRPSEEYGIYDIFVSKEPASDTVNLGKDFIDGEYGAAARHRVERTFIRASGKTPEEAKSNLFKKIDDTTKELPHIKNKSMIDFNTAFVRKIKGQPLSWAKIIPGPKLVVAGKVMTEILNDVAASKIPHSKIKGDQFDGFKKVSNRQAHTNAGDTFYPTFLVTPQEAHDLIANGRYQIENEEQDKDGNLVFDLTFVNVVRMSNEKFFLSGPGLTVGTSRLQGETTVSEDNEIIDLKYLSGISKNKEINNIGSNISLTGNEKAKLMKEYDIKPGTPEWFRLWFSRPYMTGEEPI